MEELKDESMKYIYEQIIDKIDDGLLVSDRNGKVIIYNRAAQEVEGLRAKDVLNKHLDEIYKNELDEGSEHRRVIETGEPVLNQYRNFTLPDRMGYYIHYNTYPIKKDGEIIAACTVSNNEKRLQELIYETIELKRKIAIKDSTNPGREEKTDYGATYTFEDIMGESSETSNLIREAQTMAMVDSNILIIGETGTGKEVFAQSIHNFSKKREAPFIAINCSAIPENLLESILFGTAKGAYTGALDSPGLFEDAGEGTLLLDELNSMPISMQSKLLRVLQERKARRVGASKMYTVRCRVITAINEEPRRLMEEGLLRKDLFYRISTLILYLPPLRERKKDIEALSRFFIAKNNKALKKNIVGMTEELKKMLLKYQWPGNVRELEYVIENLMIRTNDSKTLKKEDIPPYLMLDFAQTDYGREWAAGMQNQSLNSIVDNLERELITDALNQTNWNITKAAEKLQIIRQSLRCKMQRLNITKENK